MVAEIFGDGAPDREKRNIIRNFVADKINLVQIPLFLPLYIGNLVSVYFINKKAREMIQETIKRILMVVALCATIGACGSDDSDTPGKKDPGGEPQTEIKDVTDGELFKYFGLAKEQTVGKALERIKAISGRKNVDGRVVDVIAVVEESRDEQVGRFVVMVTGSVEGKAFKKRLTFDGFIRKPTDAEMARRVVVKWKSDADYYSNFDFDALYRLNETEKFTTAYLSRFVDFSSSTVDGQHHYPFGDDDLAKTVISDIRYTADATGGGSISFTLAYNGVKGNTGGGTNGRPWLPFDKNAYYAQLVVPQPNAAAAFYMRGVYEHLAVFYGNLLEYDRTKYALLLERKEKNDGENTIGMQLKLIVNDGSERELARFAKSVAGFKPLVTLNTELVLAGTAELGKQFGKRFRKTPDGDKLPQMPALPVQSWINKVQMGLKRNGGLVELLPQEEVKTGNGSSIVTVWKTSSGEGSNLDLYFESPLFEVIEAKKENQFLHMKLRLNAVNETAVDGVVVPLTVHLIGE